ncbi:MAG: hypothetical protein ACTH0V_00150 [Microbacteriaceae bacterium]
MNTSPAEPCDIAGAAPGDLLQIVGDEFLVKTTRLDRDGELVFALEGQYVWGAFELPIAAARGLGAQIADIPDPPRVVPAVVLAEARRQDAGWDVTLPDLGLSVYAGAFHAAGRVARGAASEHLGLPERLVQVELRVLPAPSEALLDREPSARG